MRTLLALTALLSVVGSLPARAAPLAPEAVPPELRGWVPWVLHAEYGYGCTRVGEELACAFPGLLELAPSGSSVRFALEVTLDRTRTVTLPGAVGEWPVEVREGTRALAVLSGEGDLPVVSLGAGSHRIEGVLRFGRQPAAIHVPVEIARIVLVSESGERQTLAPSSDGVLSLGATRSDAAAEDEADTLSIEVVRRIADGLPLAVETQIVARIGGRARALPLGRVLVPGTVPSAVESTIPVQVSAEGDLVAQAVSGTQRIRIRALAADPRAALRAPSLPPPWPTQEIWLFAPSELHRQVDVTGASSIDPQSPSIPDDWRSSAAFVVTGGGTLTLVEQRRGEAAPPPNDLSLSRSLWLDFDGSGFSAVDSLGGQWHREGRLDLVEGELGRVTVNEIDQLITVPPTGPANARGVEVRASEVRVETEVRFETPPTSLPAVGYSEGVRSLSIQLNLPPGYTLLAARGVDSAPEAWVARWDVGPIFLVLLIGVVLGRLFGRMYFGLGVATLVLIYGEPDAPTFFFLSVLVPFAIVRAFRRGLFAKFVYVVYAVTLLSLTVSCAVFIRSQLRYALHPQLVTEERVGYYGGGMLDTQAYEAMEPSAAAPAEDTEGGGGMRRMAVTGAPSSPDQDSASESYGRLENWIDPNAVVQTGYGKVDWQHSRLSLSFSGPVAADHRLALMLVPPWAQSLLAILRTLGLVGLLFVLFKHRASWPKGDDEAREDAGDARGPGASAAAAALAFGLFAAAPSATAQEAQTTPVTPSPAVLDELRQRLVEAPECGDRCVSVGDATLEARGDDLRMTFVVHAGARVGVMLPGPAAAFVPDAVTVDGATSHAMRLAPNGHVALRLEPGVHRVELVANVRGRATLALTMPHTPGRLTVAAEGWTVTGVDENGQVRGSVELRRALGATTARTEGAASTAAEVPVWVVVERHLDIGVQWLVTTRISRVSATGSPAVVRVPAFGGETVLGSEATREGALLVASLPQGTPSISFTSRIDAATPLAVSIPASDGPADGVHVTETFSFSCSPLFHCTHEGVPPLEHAVGGSFRPTFAPYPGETITVRATRLRAAPGRSFAIDGATLQLEPGARSRTGTLTLEVRTSVSDTLRLGLPRDLVVERVEVDGVRRAIEVRDGKLAIGIVPSNHRVVLTFIENTPLSLFTSTPAFTLGRSAVDARVTISVPYERWLLFAKGPAWGPVILFWGHLALVLAIAFALGRVPRSPLRTWQWALLCLGLTQLPLPLTFVVAGWFFLVQFQHERRLTRTSYNFLQVVGGFYGFVAFSVLVSAVLVGLNQRPDMDVVGNGSDGTTLHFYQDRVNGSMPVATFVSVSVWVWKGLMLVWAFWLAASVVKWSLWAVGPFRELGFFMKESAPSSAATAGQPHPYAPAAAHTASPAPASPAPSPVGPATASTDAATAPTAEQPPTSPPDAPDAPDAPEDERDDQ